MSEQYSEEQEKIDEYLNVIKTRIMEPIERSDISQYCTATLLLLFAAIDGLGKLIHDNPEAGSNERIRAFLGFMGDSYRINREELLRLRHSLVHEAMNVASFMSHTEMGSNQHLNRIGLEGFIYVNTSIMYKDFVSAFKRLQQEFRDDEYKLCHAAERLEWKDENSDYNSGDILGSPAPPVMFIWAKESNKKPE